MNTRPRFEILSLAVVALLFFSPFMAVPQAQANVGMNATVSIFHNALAPYGHWVNHRTYGQVWYPSHVARDWRPYTQGYWAYTGDYGWLWVSYEPWGWAPFHYGRWAWDNWYGWVWVPGRTWAPAWVFWRSGGGYSAWAPMPPNVVWQAGIGLNISYFNYDRDLRWDSWVAVNDRDFSNRQLHQHIHPPRQNRQVIQVTNYINNVTIVNHTIVNPGVPVKQIEDVTHRPIVPVVPVVQDKVDGNLLGQHDSSPQIVRLPMPPASHEDVHQDEELARRLDGKRADGTRAEPVNEANLAPTGNQEPSVPGRLANEAATVQAPYTTPGQSNPALTDVANPEVPAPTLPKTPLIGLGLEPDKQTTLPDATVGTVVPAVEPLGQKSPELVPTTSPPITAGEPSDPSGQPTSVEGQTDTALTNQQPGQALSPLPEEQVPKLEAQQMQQQVQQDLGQQQGQPMPRQTDPASLPIPTEDSTGASVGQTDPATINLQRQQQIDQLQEDLARRQAAQKQQELEMQQQTEQRAQQEAQQMQQQEAARQQELQMQQQLEMQQQAEQRAQQEAQQMQQQEAARQQDQQLQQQQLEMQQQAEQRAQQEAQQMQQQEAARQQDQQLQQQQLEMQQQAEQRAQQEAQQMQMQQEAARQQEQQMQQQQLEMQQQAEQRAQQEAQQMQQQEAARQQEQQMQQQQLEMQQQAQQRAQQEAQQMQQQQEAARQQEQQMQQQQQEMQQQAAQRAQQEAQQMQQQEAARQQEQPKQAQ